MKLKCAPVLLLAGDVLALVIAYFGGYWLGEHVSNMISDGHEFIAFGSRAAHPWLWLYVAVLLATVGLFGARGHYTQRSPWWEQVKYVVIVCAAMLVLAGCVLFALKLPFSRLWVGSCFLLSIPMLVAMRLVVRKIGLTIGHWGIDVAVVGGPQNALEAIYALCSDGYNVYRVREIYLLGTNTPIAVEELPKGIQYVKQTLLRADQLVAQMKKSMAEMVIVAPDEHTRMDMADFLQTVQSFNKHVAFVPPMSGMSLYGMDVQHFFGSHTVLLKPKRRVEKRLNRFFKRGLDLVGASMGMLVLSGPIALIAHIIKKDGGPAFYYQERIGKDGKTFKCWKLRSMVVNSQEVLEELLARDPDARKEWEADFKLKNDPRITRIGHLIRKTSLDELPQLWNVLKGDMSLVGPRPIVEKELEYYGKHSADYLAAKPGLTGLWQVSGRNDTSYAYRVYLDTWYVSHWSLWTDIVIILQTVWIMASRKGAY